MNRRRNAANGREWVTPSEVAEASVCPYRVYLKRSGARLSDESKNRMRIGNAKHANYNKRFETHSKLRYVLRGLIALVTLYLLVKLFALIFLMVT